MQGTQGSVLYVVDPVYQGGGPPSIHMLHEQLRGASPGPNWCNGFIFQMSRRWSRGLRGLNTAANLKPIERDVWLQEGYCAVQVWV